jgi:hypothetical protein
VADDDGMPRPEGYAEDATAGPGAEAGTEDDTDDEQAEPEETN